MHLEIFASSEGTLWRGKDDEVMKTLEKRRILKDANLIKVFSPIRRTSLPYPHIK